MSSSWSVTQVTEHLPSKPNALSSNPINIKRGKRAERMNNRLNHGKERIFGLEIRSFEIIQLAKKKKHQKK
jgi:hypothetical protein